MCAAGLKRGKAPATLQTPNTELGNVLCFGPKN